MIGKDSAELQGVLKAADHKSGRRRRQWAVRAGVCRFFLHFASFQRPRWA
jgi:hypothetical protein